MSWALKMSRISSWKNERNWKNVPGSEMSLSKDTVVGKIHLVWRNSSFFLSFIDGKLSKTIQTGLNRKLLVLLK